MTLPPFPSQDLAKLVLGYLAEEQLMTTYDEFLQASPYLDALQNEYDRIFMTSLKSILAEYRAVKIFVETCKPLLLRKMIFQCTNLLDVVKLLVNHVDLSKIQSHEVDRHGAEKLHSNSTTRTSTCESCISLKLSNCVCTSKLKTQAFNSQSSQIDDSTIQSSVEATALIDLPGNHVTTRKKQIKVLEKDSVYSSDCQTSSHDSLSYPLCVDENRSNSIQSTNSNHLRKDLSSGSLNSTVKAIDLTESRKKIEEFDSVLKSIVDKNNTVACSGSISNRVSNASTFQDFASGVSGSENPNSNVPDSSTSESLGIQAPLTKDYYKDNAIGSQIVLQVSHRNNGIDLKTVNTHKYTKIKTKPDDQKIKILSDVKVKKPIKNATSTPLTTTPLMQMQTIVINGTPAYKNTPVASHMFTKDEIMAMPTLIVVPASGSPQIPENALCQPILGQNCNEITNESSSSQSLGPLVIDLPPPPAVNTKPEGNKKLPTVMPACSEAGLVKTVDFKNASVPKDNAASCASKTPQGLPPVRKSSSTPRRTTHVRVLDFTAPRRILQETINEQVPEQASQHPAEVVLSNNPNISSNTTVVAQNPSVNSNTTAFQSTTTVPNADSCGTDTGSAKENTSQPIVPFKKSNWDADLRALVAKEANLGCTGKFKKGSRKKKATDKSDKTNKKTPKTNDSTSKIKKTPKKRRKVVEVEELPVAEEATKPDASVKPTINIITTTKKESTEDVLITPETNKIYENFNNKSDDKEQDSNETPESERLSLQNVIGARLNISDLLETPYKQALYDIQMGTPKFLPDLPGEPLSDIKITNIPTPRFLDTPKPIQATPSSWSSRPTDYSSGGSYYKPDDQDYLPISDLRCVVSSSSSKEDTALDKSLEIVKDDEKKTRPQRQCTKNVSYYRFANATNRAKEADDTVETISTCSDSIGSCKNESVVKTPKPKTNKSETKKKVSAKRRKSPAVKDKPKSLTKIKPRQTPTKLTPGRIRKKKGYTPNKYRRNTSKDDNIDPETMVVAAPTKSRRKSSTPRKLHCSQSSSSHTSPETAVKVKPNVSREVALDSDTEQIALRWSDDGSQDTKSNKDSPPTLAINDCEDIYQIQKYIQNTDSSRSQPMLQESHPSFQADLMKRGFDIETAKIIERDLLDASGSHSNLITKQSSTAETPAKNLEPTSKKAVAVTGVNIPEPFTPDDADGEEDVVFSSYECNEESENFIVVEHDDTKEIPQSSPIKLKDTFSFEICIDDDLTVRLKAPPFHLLLDEDPTAVETIDYSYKETEMAVNSIINMDRLYTPHKDSYKSQCYEIFDSTLTSLDTPLKACTPRREETPSVTTVTDVVLEEQEQEKQDAEAKKRKRSSSSDGSTSDTKKTKYLLTSASIQNIDIESVLTKLHGP